MELKQAGPRDVSRDYEGLRKAAWEFFLEGYEYPEVQRMLNRTKPEHQAAARRRLCTPKTLPEGYFTWISYLVWLERILEIAPLPLLAVEAEGLLVLRRERNRFQNAHPPCPYCGMPNQAKALRCRECMKELGG